MNPKELMRRTIIPEGQKLRIVQAYLLAGVCSTMAQGATRIAF